MQQIKTINISGRECHLYIQPEAHHLLVQPVDQHDLHLLEQEVSIIQATTPKPFSLVAFMVDDWNSELTPWPSPPVFGKQPFGDQAKDTLDYILHELLPALPPIMGSVTHCLLGGYSLAGLFALWAAYQTSQFEGIAAASPSVWYPGWTQYAADHTPHAPSIYLSLGDKEEKTRNPIMAQVGNAIRQQHTLLTQQGITTHLDWNPGNHFIDSERRMAKAFAWLLNVTAMF